MPKGGVGVGVAVTLGVAVGVEEGVGVGVISDGNGAGTGTEIGAPVLKNPMVAEPPGSGGPLASNRKLYNVPQRIAFALAFC